VSILGGAGVNSMMVMLLMAGIGLLLAGLLAIGFGIPVQEFSFGNTLILAGSVAACTGVMMLGLWTVVRELKNIARRLGPEGATASGAGTQRENQGFSFDREQLAPENAGHDEPAAPAPAPWQEEAAARDRGRKEPASMPEPDEAEPVVKPRRNLLFSSSSRKERERAPARPADPLAADLRPAPSAAPSPPKASEPPPATFDDAWPQSERARPADASTPGRSGRAPSTFPEAGAGAAGADRYPPAARNQDKPPVTVLKSGVVDGMAYSLYSDGSIEAQMPEGMMRFASIDELRSHLDQRP
jgi:hypothetical protein